MSGRHVWPKRPGTWERVEAQSTRPDGLGRHLAADTHATRERELDALLKIVTDARGPDPRYLEVTITACTHPALWRAQRMRDGALVKFCAECGAEL